MSSSQSTSMRQSDSQEKRFETRSGRAIKMPSKYGDFFLDGKVNIITEQQLVLTKLLRQVSSISIDDLDVNVLVRD